MTEQDEAFLRKIIEHYEDGCTIWDVCDEHDLMRLLQTLDSDRRPPPPEYGRGTPITGDHEF